MKSTEVSEKKPRKKRIDQKAEEDWPPKTPGWEDFDMQSTYDLLAELLSEQLDYNIRFVRVDKNKKTN